MDGLRLERVKASAQWRDGTFHNTHFQRPEVQGSKLPLIGEWLFKGKNRRPPAPLPIDRPHDRWGRGIDSGLRATWLGHSTVLLELDGRRVLTDPVLANRIGPVRFAGPRRFHPVPATIEELPPLDVVLISHDHFDHLCRSTVEHLASLRVPIVTALGVGHYLEKYGVDPAVITELDWHESAEVGGVHFTATPSQHFSGRGLTSRNRTLWASWVMAGDRHKVFFSGDTGLTPEFEATRAKHGPFDLVMLEVGAYHPAWGSIHLGPENALEAFDLLGGGTLLPVHWGTFSLGFHAWDAPGEELLALAATRSDRILTPRLGQVFEPAQLDGPTPWWRGLAGAAEPAVVPAT